MFDLTDDQLAIREAVRRTLEPFDEAYWRACDAEHRFPDDYRQAMAEGGWLGVAMPEAWGGAGLGVVEAAVMMEAVANSPGGMAAASAIHINIFGPEAIHRHGTQAQRARWLPKIISGELITCFGVTEPDAGLETTRIKTRATRTNEGWSISGAKIWTTTAQQAERVMLLVRTTPLEEVAKPTEGLTLFFAPLDPAHVTITEIPKMGRHAVNSNVVHYDALPVTDEDMIGEEGQGFRLILDSLNPERVLIAAEAIGVGRQALSRAVRYAKEREVFGRPIGANQSIQHPLAESHMELEAAWLTTLRAGALYDAGQPCGVEANSAKWLGAEAGYRACERAVMTHGGMGYAAEYGVERLLREVWINRLAPVSQQLVLCHVAERALGLPKSY
ncbi:MAG: acyl-CoA dehydrogenase family protein [Pseudomonadota bacterium]